jgi:peroxiredoxin
LLAQSSLVARADETALIAPAAPPVEGVKLAVYPPVRIGDIAPTFDLPDTDGVLRNPQALLGQWSLMVVLLNDSAAKPVDPAALQQLISVAPTLQNQNVAVFVITGDKRYDALFKAKPNLMQLRDDKALLRNMFGPSPSGITVLGIDRAGFLRRVEHVRDPLALSPTLALMGDVTPKLEVGKPAPDFSVVDMNGQVRRLADLRGQKNLLLSFFPKCFTGG